MNITKPMKCIQMRSGVEIWVEAERADRAMQAFLAPNPTQFIEYEGRLINRADVVGVFFPEDMEDSKRRRWGQEKCEWGRYHKRGEECECRTMHSKEVIEKKQKAISNCGKCKDGWTVVAGMAKMCECLKNH